MSVMRIARLTLYRLRIPMLVRLEHAKAARESTDNLVCEVELDDGTIGHGEGVPRDYVTGETFDEAWQVVTGCRPALGRAVGSLDEAIAYVEALTAAIPDDPPRAVRNAARCTLELGLLDAFCRSTRTSLGDLLARRFGHPSPPAAPHLGYSLVASRGLLRDRAALTALRDQLGYRAVKVKVGFGLREDTEHVARVREVFGEAVDIRVDANREWALADAVATMRALAPLGVRAVEDPIAGATLAEVEEGHRRLTAETGAQVVLDETVRTYDEAAHAARTRAGDVINLRVSKCGGLLRSIDAARVASQGGLALQLGCQVGESAILSAAGRHLASAIGNLRYLEGSNERMKFAPEHFLSTVDLTYGQGGDAPVLDGPGLGIEVLRDRLRACAEVSAEVIS